MMMTSGPSLIEIPFLRDLVYFAIFAGGFVYVLRKGLLFPRHFRLECKGLDLLIAGRPIEAEACYREALAMGSKVPPADRIRLLVCLGDALFDQARFPESKQYLEEALSLGDPSGSGQSSMADLLIEQGTDPQQALDMADEAMELSAGPLNQQFGAGWSAVSSNLRQATGWACKAQALQQLDRKTEARQAIERALRFAEEADAGAAHTSPKASLLAKLILGPRLQIMKNLSVTAAHWRVGLALLALRDTNKAAEHFRIARGSDPKGKYRRLAQQQLERLGSWAV
jgi:tetratricopeptide (TPR) repeat protein